MSKIEVLDGTTGTVVQPETTTKEKTTKEKTEVIKSKCLLNGSGKLNGEPVNFITGYTQIQQSSIVEPMAKEIANLLKGSKFQLLQLRRTYQGSLQGKVQKFGTCFRLECNDMQTRDTEREAIKAKFGFAYKGKAKAYYAFTFELSVIGSENYPRVSKDDIEKTQGIIIAKGI